MKGKEERSVLVAKMSEYTIILNIEQDRVFLWVFWILIAFLILISLTRFGQTIIYFMNRQAICLESQFCLELGRQMIVLKG